MTMREHRSSVFLEHGYGLSRGQLWTDVAREILDLRGESASLKQWSDRAPTGGWLVSCLCLRPQCSRWPAQPGPVRTRPASLFGCSRARTVTTCCVAAAVATRSKAWTATTCSTAEEGLTGSTAAPAMTGSSEAPVTTSLPAVRAG